MDAVYPATESALARGRRLRRREPRVRHRTMPVTFAEIKEVDEEGDAGEERACSVSEERRRRPDLLEERLGRQFAEFRRRRARTEALRELSPPGPTAPPGPGPGPGAPAATPRPAPRASSEPEALNRPPALT